MGWRGGHASHDVEALLRTTVRDMAPGVLAFGVALIFLLPSPGAAQSADPVFPEASGAVRAFVTSGDTLYFGGDFSWVGEHTGAAALLDPATGKRDRSWSVVDGIPGEVRAIAPDGEGGWYVGGHFSCEVAGPGYLDIVHIRADRSFDDWRPAPQIYVTAILPRGALLFVAGGFQTVFDEPRKGFAVFDRHSGALLRRFDMLDAWGGASCLAANDSVVFVGGGYSSFGGRQRIGLASVDLASGRVTDWDPGLEDGSALCLAHSDSVLYVGGDFTRVRGLDRKGLAAFDLRTGELLPWNPGVASTPNEILSVDALAIVGGAVYVGGRFGQLGGQPRRNLGSVDAHSGVVTPWSPDMDGGVNCLASNGERLWAGGWFFHAGDAERPYLAEFDASTGELTTWEPRPSDVVYCASPDGQRVFVGGSFRAASTLRRLGLAAVDLATGTPTSWAPTAGGSVHALAAARGTVFVGGSFTATGGGIGSNLAAVDAVSGLPRPGWPYVDAPINTLVARDSLLYAGGWFTRIDYTRRRGLAELDCRTGRLTSWSPDLHGSVQALALAADRLYAGGAFDSAGGQARSRLAAFELSDRSLAAWNPGVNGTVYALAASGPLLYVGGDFSATGGQARINVASVDVGSGIATPWNPVAYGTVRSLAPTPGRILLGGDFSTVHGQVRPSIARVDSVTALPEAWAPFDGTANVNVVLPRGGRVYAGGDFSGIAGMNRLCFASVGADGPLPLAATLLAPESGRSFQPGDTLDVRWHAAGGRGIEAVDILLARTGPAGPWEVLASGLPNTGEYGWKVTAPPTESAWLRLDARDYAGALTTVLSNSAFSIGGLLTVPAVGRAGTLALGTPFPSPARGRASVEFVLPVRGPASLCLFDVQGREVRRFVDEVLSAGRRVETLNFVGLKPGLYFLRLGAGGERVTVRAALLR